MMKFLRKYRYHIFLFTLAVFLLGTFIGFGSYFFSGAPGGDSIAEVNGKEIPTRLFYSHYNRALDAVAPGTVLDENARRQKRDEAIRDLVQMEVFRQLARQFRIVVPDQQVANHLAQIPAFQENGAFSPQAYLRVLQYQLKSNPRDFEEEQRASIAFFKLRWLVQSCVKVTDKELENQFAFRGDAFAKANVETTEGGKARRRRPAEIRELFRDHLWQEKVMWAFNQWFNQIGQKTRVKTHLEILEGGAR